MQIIREHTIGSKARLGDVFQVAPSGNYYLVIEGEVYVYGINLSDGITTFGRALQLHTIDEFNEFLEHKNATVYSREDFALKLIPKPTQI